MVNTHPEIKLSRTRHYTVTPYRGFQYSPALAKNSVKEAYDLLLRCEVSEELHEYVHIERKMCPGRGTPGIMMLLEKYLIRPKILLP
jgi:hypothetical protein